MSLQDVSLKQEYRSLLDNVAREFYIPLLKNAISYKRAVGFFSSSILVEISNGIMGLVRNKGSIQLIVSPYLSEEDVQAINSGYAQRDEVLKKALFNEFHEPKDVFQEERLNLLANLIADGYLDVKVAVTESDSGIGMYHEKVGIIEDAEGNKVAFTGSSNESANALLANYETIDVYTSWSNDCQRIENKEMAFRAIWEGYEPNIKTLNFSEFKTEFVKRYKKTDVDYDNYSEDVVGNNKELFFRVPSDVEFYDYQNEAIEKWHDRKYCGIFDMATGSGKTYTALGALSSLSKILEDQLAVIIVVPYQHLVEQWIEDINRFNVEPIVAYSYPGQHWRKDFNNAVLAYNQGVSKNFCVITTNATFALDDFQLILAKFKKNYCFVVDEAHNFGAKKLSQLLPKKARYRLALSATIERHRDEEGTEALRKYFGRTPCISFSLKDAIDKGFLTSYYYYPVLVNLNEDELEEYQNLTKKIIKNGGASEENLKKNDYVELLLIKRARIIAGCQQKIDRLIEVIRPYKDDAHILVYCGATKYDLQSIDDIDQIKQIDAVNKRLYCDLNMKVRKFTSSESKEERNEIKQLFQEGELQVITAIKCLDEGVNIPAIKRAFILASSTNPKEYIQRRGRVLRRASGKEYAEIFDFITLPRPLEMVKFYSKEELAYDLTLVKKEFTRMVDFAETARNPFEIDDLKFKIEETYRNAMNGGFYNGTI